MKETIGAVIKAARTEGMALTRVAFAALVAVTDQSIYYWEIGKRSPRADTFTRLLDVVPPAFALRLLTAAGMDNAEWWAICLAEEANSGVANPSDILGKDTKANDE